MCGILGAGPASAEVTVNLQVAAEGLTAPLNMISPQDGTKRRFITEQIGVIKILLPDGKMVDEPFLDIRNKLVPLLADFDERGVIGLAFHPKYKENGKFYVAYTSITARATRAASSGGTTRMSWPSTQVSKDDPNIANPNSEKVISAIDWPQFNHNGHWIGFGNDGMLYISTGDGGYANDWGIGHNVTEGNGQDLMDCTARCSAWTSTTATPTASRRTTRSPTATTRCPRSAPRPAQPLALLVRHGRQQRALLRRRAAERIRGSQHHLQGCELRLAQDGSQQVLRLS